MKRIMTIRHIIFIASILVITTILIDNTVSVEAETDLPIVSCESTLLSPVDSSGNIYLNSGVVFTGEDGQILYLISDATHSLHAELIHVREDDSIRRIDTIPIARDYGVARWYIDREFSRLIYHAGESIDRLTIKTGEHTTIARQVSVYLQGKVDDYVWWTSTETVLNERLASYSFTLYDPQTELSYVLQFPEGILGPRSFRLLDGNEAILGILRNSHDGIRNANVLFFYRVNLISGESQLLHDDVLAFDGSSSSAIGFIAENSIIYINQNGILKEIDFEGNILRQEGLQGSGYYKHIMILSSGIFYQYSSFDGNVQNFVYVPEIGESSSLFLDDVDATSIRNIQLVMNSRGEEQIWINTWNERTNTGTLYVISFTGGLNIPFILSNVVGFAISPGGNYAVIKRDDQAYIFSTETFEFITRAGRYNGQRQFSTMDEHVIFSIDNTIVIYNFAEQSRYAVSVSTQDYPRAFFIDNEQDFVYILDTIPIVTDDGYYHEHRQLYVTTFDAHPPVLVSLPDLDIPFDPHAASLLATATNDILYVNENWQELYRARCHRNP